MYVRRQGCDFVIHLGGGTRPPGAHNKGCCRAGTQCQFDDRFAVVAFVGLERSIAGNDEDRAVRGDGRTGSAVLNSAARSSHGGAPACGNAPWCDIDGYQPAPRRRSALGNGSKWNEDMALGQCQSGALFARSRR
jgi:hypothetical protein